MTQVAGEWQLEVDRGPDWLFVRLHPPIDSDMEPDLAGAVWDLLEKHFTYRVVLEMHDVDQLSSHLIGQLILLQKRVHQHGGVLRLCGLCEHAIESLHLCRLDGGLPNYRDREEAVLGPRMVRAK